MKNVIIGPVVAATVAARLCTHRRTSMDILVGCPLSTTAKYDTAMNPTLAYQDLATLQKWYRNTVCEVAHHEEGEPKTAPVTYATGPQKQEIICLTDQPKISRAEKIAVLLTINRFTTTEATATIGNLWANSLAQPIENPPTAGQSHASGSASYSSAA